MLRPSRWNHAAIVQKCKTEEDCQRALQVLVYLKRSGLNAPTNDVYSTWKESGFVVLDNRYSVDGVVHEQELSFWNSFITNLVKSGDTKRALDMYQHMPQKISPSINPRTFGALLKSCAKAGDLNAGIRIHADVSKRELLEHDVFIGSALVDMYAKCDCLSKAQEVFDSLRIRDVVSWTALIRGYVESANSRYGLHYFEQMQHEGISPDDVTFSCALKGCSNIGETVKGRQIHVEVTKKGLENDLFIGNTLIDLYARSGAFSDACQVFRKLSVRDVVSWNALIAGYVENDCNEEALDCYEEMKRSSVSPEAATYVSCMKACTNMGLTSIAEEIHADISRRGLKGNPFIGSALIDMYAKLGLLTKAHGVFDDLPERNVVSWTALITAYAEHGVFDVAINCFELMWYEGISAVTATFLSTLRTCGVMGAIADGWKLHADISKLGLEKDLVIGSTLVDMYTKYGSLQDAQQVFDILPVHDVVSWSVLISGYAQLGKSEDVFRTFDRMVQGGLKPNVVTFGSVLYVCNHAGLVDKGQMYFESMSKEYGISPSFEHHVCVADLLGRAGEFGKALILVQKMPFHPGSASWISVMTACRKWGNLDVAQQAFGNLLCVDATDPSAYVCLSNIYSDGYHNQESV